LSARKRIIAAKPANMTYEEAAGLLEAGKLGR